MTQSASDCYRNWLYALLLLSGCSGSNTLDSAGALDSDINEVVDPRIEAFLQRMIGEERFSGGVLVAIDGAVVHAKGYGIAVENTPNNVHTAFHVGSVTKQFTAAAIMQLVEAGTLTLHESINFFLPERYRTRSWNDVHLHHLLSHSSGIPDYAITRDYYRILDGFCLGDTVDGMIREAMGKDLEFEPGTKFAYSNMGFTLLGSIIEEQTESSYDRYMKENILQPMGMRSSRIHIEGHVPTKTEAAGHRWDEDKQQHVKDDVVILPVTAPDGGLITTLGDFLQWIRLYSGENQSILAQASVDTMMTPQISFAGGGSIDGYGYGLGVGERLISHSGYIVGFRSGFDFDRQTGTLIAVFTNNTENDPGVISSGLLTIMLSPES